MKIKLGRIIMRKVLSIMLTFVLLLSLAPQTKANNVGFKDVPKSHPNYTEIMYLLEKGVIEPAEKFGVSQKITREEAATMVAKAIGLDGKKTKTKFKDVAENRYSSGYINSAVRAGIIKGYPDGTFKPTQQVTRGHMAVFIANAFKLNNQADIKFKDVPKRSTSYVAVRKLAAANITSGYPDGTFKPNEGLSKAHISAFIARAMNPAFRPASETYYGEWIINQVQAYGVGTYSSEDAESLLGKSLTFTANKASYFGDKLSDIVKVATNPIYTETIIPESDFVEKHRIPFDLLGLKAPITEINVSDSKGHVSTFFIKDDHTLIIFGGGTYFELIRKVPKNK